MKGRQAAKPPPPPPKPAAPVQTKSQAQSAINASTHNLLRQGYTISQIEANKIPKADQQARAGLVAAFNVAGPDPARKSSPAPAPAPAAKASSAPSSGGYSAPAPASRAPDPVYGGSMVGRRGSSRFTESRYNQGREMYESGVGGQPASVTSGRAQADSEAQVQARATDIAEELRRNRERQRLARLGR
jgi:hypothetical protein